jgi:hypothetical protein
MRDDIANASPVPAWLGAPLLQPGEGVVWWRGPREGRLLRWLKGRVGLLFAISCAATAVFPFAGKGLGMLLGWADGGAGFFCGLAAGLGCGAATMAVGILADQDVFHVLTDRRLLVIKGRHLVHAYDLDLLRRLVAISDAARAAGMAADEHVLDAGKVRPLLTRPAEGITEIEPVLRVLHAFRPARGTGSGFPGEQP